MSAEGFPSLRNDVRLVKAALLYADEVELLGLAAGLVHSLGLTPQSQRLTLRQMMELTDGVTGSKTLTPAHRQLLLLTERLNKSGAALPAHVSEGLRDIETVEAEARRLLSEGQRDVIDSTGADELVPALQAGVVSVASVGGDLESALMAATGRRDNAETTKEVAQWVHEVRLRMIDHRTRLLLDEQSEDHVRALLAEGVIPADQVGLRLASKAAIGAGFVARLPSFPHVRMDELIDFRRELGAPLIRYRSAVSRFSRQLPSLASTALQPGVSELWETEVSPAVLEINELLHEHTFMKEAARAVGQSVGVYAAAGASIWVGLGATSEVDRLVAAAIAAAPKGAQTAVDTTMGVWEAKRAARKHELFYLHSIEDSMRSDRR
jgi:hypothetical protein